MRKVVEKKDFDGIKKLLNKNYTKTEIEYLTGFKHATIERVASVDTYEAYKALVKKQHPKRIVVTDAKKSFWDKILSAVRFG